MELSLSKCNYEDLAADRADYLFTTTTALDGMWENAFFSMANHWEISCQGQPIGYCSVNSEGRMLGFVVHNFEMQRPAFASCIEMLGVSGAFVSTAEPIYLSLCTDHQSAMSVYALMYMEGDEEPIVSPTPFGMNFRVAGPDDFDIAVSFGVATIQADRDWLSEYFAERIKQNELFGLWSGTELVATGECRASPNQTCIADVGMIVGTSHRKKGLASFMLQKLRYVGRQKGLKLICSTENGNTGAQKAIERAGFVSQHRILDFTF